MHEAASHHDLDAALRMRAEQQIIEVNESDTLDTLSPDEARRVLHELRVHQIELEMQNEDLRRTQEDLEASRARYFDLYDLAPVGYFALSEEGLILESEFHGSQIAGCDQKRNSQAALLAFYSSRVRAYSFQRPRAASRYRSAAGLGAAVGKEGCRLILGAPGGGPCAGPGWDLRTPHGDQRYH